MGTRGVWGVRYQNKDKITYNHFDSYPDNLGETIKKFIIKHSVEELKQIASKIILVDRNMKPTKEQIEACKDYMNLYVSEQSPEDWYCLLHKSQGEPEAYIKGLIFMIDSCNFMKDSLFCEWAYIINLDTNKLEIYRGFQKEPQNNRYYCEADQGYANCALIHEIPLEEVKILDMHKLQEEIYGKD